MKSRNLAKLLLLALCFLLAGCTGGNDSPSVSAGPAASGPGANNANPTATIILRSTLLRVIPAAVTDLRFTGRDANNNIVFGPKTVAKAAEITLVVPTSMTSLLIEYLQGSTVVNSATRQVSLQPGTSLVIDDLQVNPVPLVSIIVTPPNATFPVNTTRGYSATGVFDDGSSVDLTSTVTWSTGNAATANVSNTGVVRGNAVGTTTVTATSAGVSGSADATVRAAVASSIQVSAASTSLLVGPVAPGQTTQASAIATFDNGTSLDVTNGATWSSSNNAVASVSNSGLITALGAGSATITATFGGQSQGVVINVNTATLNSITVLPPNSSTFTGNKTQFVATGVFSGGFSSDLSSSVTWGITPPDLGTFDSTGLFTATKAGAGVVNATLSGITGSTNITIANLQLVNLTLTPQNPNVPAGTTLQLRVIGNYNDGSQIDQTANATYLSFSPNNATVSNAGVVSALIPNTTAIVGATLNINPGNDTTQNTTINITDATLVRLLFPTTISHVQIGKVTRLKIFGQFSDSSISDVSQSSNWALASGIATVNNVAPNKGVITGVSAGSTQLTVTNGAINATANVSVGSQYVVTDGNSLNFHDISTTGTPVFSAGTGAPFAQPVELGIPFTFYGETYTTGFMADAGTFSFTDNRQFSTGENMVDGTDNGDLTAGLAVAWGDTLFPITKWIQVDGVAPNRTLTIQWHGAPSNDLDYEIVLSEADGSIRMLYQFGPLPGYGDAHVAGIQNQDTLEGTEYSHFQLNSLFNGQSLLFR